VTQIVVFSGGERSNDHSVYFSGSRSRIIRIRAQVAAKCAESTSSTQYHTIKLIDNARGNWNLSSILSFQLFPMIPLYIVDNFYDNVTSAASHAGARRNIVKDKKQEACVVNYFTVTLLD
jgi:hypothetical protein